MGSITSFLANELLDHSLNKATFNPATTLYLILATADPTDAATGASCNEVPNSGSYQRTAIGFAAASGRVIDQSGDVTFPQATGAWGDVTHWAIADSQTYGAGNVYAHGAFNETKSIVSGNTPSVDAGSNDVNVTIDAGYCSNYLATILLDFAFRDQTFTSPTTYVCACTATISDSDTGASISEPGAGAYARKLVYENGGGTPDWDLAASEVVDNSDDIDFTTATASWGTIVATAITDNPTTGAGNLLFYDNGTADQAVGNGDTYQYPAGDLDVGLD